MLRWNVVKALLAALFLLTGGALIAQSEIPFEDQQPVSLAFQDAPVSVVLQALADARRLNLVVADGVEGKLSLRLEEVPWEQALAIVLRAGKLEAEREGGVISVFPFREPTPEESVPPPSVLVTFSYRVRHADAVELAKVLNSQRGVALSDSGSAVADGRSNSLLVRTEEGAVDAVKALLAEVDVPQPQVLLTAHIVTINSERLEELGVRWGWGDVEAAGAGVASRFSVNLPLSTPAGQFGFQMARIDGRLLGLELSALEAENSVEIIASPRLITLSQQTASIKQGTEIPYEVSSGSSGATSIEFKQAVLGLKVTPRIFSDERLELDLQISQNMPGKGLKKGDGSEVLTIDTQEIQTRVFVANGETIALGGIFQHSRVASKEQVPVLGDIPLLGSLFQRDANKRVRRELVIFITPTIVGTGAESEKRKEG